MHEWLHATEKVGLVKAIVQKPKLRMHTKDTKGIKIDILAALKTEFSKARRIWKKYETELNQLQIKEAHHLEREKVLRCRMVDCKKLVTKILKITKRGAAANAWTAVE